MNTAFIISLLVVGIILLLIEIFVIPGIGVAGILGIAAVIAGCYFSYDWGTRAGMIVTGGVIVIIIIFLIVALRSKTWEKLALKTNVESSAGQDSTVITVGDSGVTTTRLAPMGSARIEGKTMEVKSYEGFVSPGVDVEVVMIEDNIIYVRPVSEIQ